MYIQITNNNLMAWSDKEFQGYTKIVTVSYDDYITHPNKWIFNGSDFDLNPNWQAEELTEAKDRKNKENDKKAEQARTSKTFILTLQNKQCEFDTKSQTQADLLTAFAVCSQGTTYDGWVCNNGVVIDLTLEDVVVVSATFKELSNVYPKWNEYKTQIEACTTKAQVDAIIINYED